MDIQSTRADGRLVLPEMETDPTSILQYIETGQFPRTENEERKHDVTIYIFTGHKMGGRDGISKRGNSSLTFLSPCFFTDSMRLLDRKAKLYIKRVSSKSFS